MPRENPFACMSLPKGSVPDMDERRPGGEVIHAPLRLLLTVCALKEGMEYGIISVKQIGFCEDVMQ